MLAECERLARDAHKVIDDPTLASQFDPAYQAKLISFIAEQKELLRHNHEDVIELSDSEGGAARKTQVHRTITPVPLQ